MENITCVQEHYAYHVAELFTGFIYLSCYYTCMCAFVNMHTIHVHALYMLWYACVYG